MTDMPTSEPEGTSSDTSTHLSTSTRATELVATSRSDRELWKETGVVLVIGVIVPFFNALMHLAWPELWHASSFASYALPGIVAHIGTVVTVFYLVAHSQEPLSAFGLTPLRWWRDSFTVAGLLVLDLFFNHYSHFILERLFGLSVQDFLSFQAAFSYPIPIGFRDYTLVVAFSAANGLSEELVMRGYLLPRFERLLQSTGKSLFLTSALFAAYHVYWGPGGVLSCLLAGLLYGAFFCWLRRLWPLVAAHILWDVNAFAGLLP